MILSLAVIITNITLIYLSFNFKKSIKLHVDECEAIMRELTENSLKEFLKEVKRHDKEFHKIETEYDARFTHGMKNGENPYVKGTDAFEKCEESKREEKGEKISKALRAYHARKKNEKDQAFLTSLAEKREKARARSRAWNDRKKEERKRAAAIKQQPTFEPYKAFVRPGEVSIQ